MKWLKHKNSARGIRTALLFAALVVVIEVAGGFDSLERGWDDLRARFCSYNSVAPSPAVVHIDIDDSSIERMASDPNVGAWPWPRSVVAGIVDEIRAAGAKVVALDVILSERQRPSATTEPNGSIRMVDEDGSLRAAISNAGNVILPLSVDMWPPNDSPMFRRIVALLKSDLQMLGDDVQQRLVSEGVSGAEAAEAVKRYISRARTRAMTERIDEAPDSTLRALETVLLPRPNGSPNTFDGRQLLQRLASQSRTTQHLRRSEFTPAANLEGLVGARLSNVPLPDFGAGAKYLGFVDVVFRDDGVVRGVPLLVRHEGRALPHLALLTVCAMMDVDPSSVQVLRDRIQIPIPASHGGDLEIPVRNIQLDGIGQVGAYFDIAWFGISKWETMYDHPTFKQSLRHHPVARIWTLHQSKSDRAHNLEEATRLMSWLTQRTALASLPAGGAEDRRDVRIKINAVAAELATVLQGERLDGKEDNPLTTLNQIRETLKKISDQVAEVDREESAIAAELRGRAVLVGWAATGTGDAHPTPLHAKCPGVVINGVIVNNLLSRSFLRVAPGYLNWSLALLLGAIAIPAALFIRPPYSLLCCAGIAVAYLAFNGFVAFDRWNWSLAAVAPVAAMATTSLYITVGRAASEARERARIKRRFETYVDPALVNYFIENPHRMGFREYRELTVVFTDLANFSTMMERLREQTIPILNGYLNKLVPIIRRNGGFLSSKFMGDGMMFFFGAPRPCPDHADRAARTVIQLRAAMEEVNQALRARDRPTLELRVGVNTGVMLAGDTGCSVRNFRAREFTVLGDAVNLGARLESANKQLGTNVLIAEQTRMQLGDDLLVRPIGKLRVVGRLMPVVVFELLCLQCNATDAQRRLVTHSKRVVEAYAAGNFPGCLEALSQLDVECGESKFAQRYRMCCEAAIVALPPGFSGELVLTEK